MATGPGE